MAVGIGGQEQYLRSGVLGADADRGEVRLGEGRLGGVDDLVADVLGVLGVGLVGDVAVLDFLAGDDRRLRLALGDGDARPAGQREPLDRNGGRTDREVHGALVGEHVAPFLPDRRDVLLVQVRGAGGGMAILDTYLPVRIGELAPINPAPVIGLVLGIYGVLTTVATWLTGRIVDRVGPAKHCRIRLQQVRGASHPQSRRACGPEDARYFRLQDPPR